MRLPRTSGFCGLLALTTLSGCSLIYDLSPDQCGNDTDCASFGQGYACVEGICKGNTRGECEQASDCLTFATEPTACIEKERGNPGSTECETLRTAECPLIMPTGGPGQEKWFDLLSARNTIIVGGFAEVDLDGISTFSANYDLAFTELSESSGGVPGPDGSIRPLVAVVCNNNLDLGGLSAGMDHLVEDLNVPGVVAAMPSDSLRTLFSNFHTSDTNPNVFLMSPLEADSTIESIEDDDLIWTLLPSTEQLAYAYQPLLTRTIDYLRAHRSVAEDEVIKLSVVVAPDLPGMEELASAVEDVLVFNGMTFAENVDAGNIQQLRVVSFRQDPNADLSPQVEQILEFSPHVVLGLGADEIFSDVIPYVDGPWVSTAPAGQQRPYYLMSPYHINSPSFSRVYLNGIITITDPDGPMGPEMGDPFDLRVAGVNYASAPEEYQHLLRAYEQRLAALFPDDAVRGWENYYDAPWWLIYAFAAGVGTKTRFDGRDLVDGMSRLQGGPEYAMGPDEIDQAMRDLLLDPNGSIQLNGTLGPPSFDNTGTRQSLGSVWCVNFDATFILDALRVDDSGDEPVLTGSGFTICNPDF